MGVDARTVAQDRVGLTDALESTKGIITFAQRIALAALGACARVVASAAVLVVPSLGVDASVGGAQGTLAVAFFIDLAIAILIAASTFVPQLRQDRTFARGLPLSVCSAALDTTLAVAHIRKSRIPGITRPRFACGASTRTVIVDLAVAIAV